MNPASLYRPRGRSIFWVAFVSSLTIHIGAVALARTKLPTGRLEHFTPSEAIDIVDAAERQPPLGESVTPPPSEEIHSDPEVFREENFARPLNCTGLSRRHNKLRALFDRNTASSYEAD